MIPEIDRAAPSRVSTVMAAIVRRMVGRRDVRRGGFSGGADHGRSSEEEREEREEEAPLPRRGVWPGRGEGG